MPKCSICNRADRSQIDAALVSGVSIRALEARHSGTTRSALDRHRKHIPPALTRAKQAEEVTEATGLLSRVEKWLSRCERLFDRAEAAKEWRGAAAAAREVRGALELLGKLNGELQTSKGATINLAVIEQLNIAALSTDQVAAIYDRIQSEHLAEISRMSNEELKERLAEFAFRAGFEKTAVRKSPFFDEETVPVAPGHISWMNHAEPEWRPYRNSTASDRFQMLRVAWKRLTALELPAGIREEDLGANAAITIEFYLADQGETGWPDFWPTVRLVAVSGPGDVPKSIPGAPPQLIEGA